MEMEYDIRTISSLIESYRAPGVSLATTESQRLFNARRYYELLRIREVLELSDDFRGVAFLMWELESMIMNL